MKIARWNDVNFYALKQAVARTHRTLHKHMKHFRLLLNQPVKQFLVETTSDAEEHAHTDEGHVTGSIDARAFLISLPFVVSTRSVHV